jgi:RNA polymerase sigma-70 factor (ECF subfamily)
MPQVSARMTGQPTTVHPAAGGLARLYEQHRPEILRYLRARTGDPAEAEDVVQELWIKVQSGDSGPVANGRAYLFRMAHNLVLDRLREQRRRRLRDSSWSVERSAGVTSDGDLVDPGQGAESELVAGEDLARLANAIEQLPAGARRAFCLDSATVKLRRAWASAAAAWKSMSPWQCSSCEEHSATEVAACRRRLQSATHETTGSRQPASETAHE